MIEISRIAAHFSHVQCPTCHDVRPLTAVLRCDLNDRECVAVACCEHCQSIFTIEAEQLRENSRPGEFRVSCSADSGVCVIEPAKAA